MELDDHLKRVAFSSFVSAKFDSEEDGLSDYDDEFLTTIMKLAPPGVVFRGQDFGDACSFAQAPQNCAARFKKRTDLVSLCRRQKCSRRILSSEALMDVTPACGLADLKPVGDCLLNNIDVRDQPDGAALADDVLQSLQRLI